MKTLLPLFEVKYEPFTYSVVAEWSALGTHCGNLVYSVPPRKMFWKQINPASVPAGKGAVLADSNPRFKLFTVFGFGSRGIPTPGK